MKTRSQRLLETVDEVMGPNYRTASRRTEARAANAPTMRALEDPEDIPNGYRAATENRALVQADLDPTMWPGYDPYGKPANGYDMALALRKVNAENAPIVVAAAARPEPTVIYDEHGVPDGYRTAIERNRR